MDNSLFEQVHSPEADAAQRKVLYQQYCTSIDSAKVTQCHYRRDRRSWINIPEQEELINRITNWVYENNPDNRPLVLETEPGCGVKTLLVEWAQRISEVEPKDRVLTILHFVSNGSSHANYFYSLYKIIIKLREALRLKQNVHLLEENIRKFFSYWLDVCSSEIQKQQIVFCAQDIYAKVVIVFEAVQEFLDPQTGKEATIAFWLPECFPKNVKVIIAAKQGSQSLDHLAKNKCDVIKINCFPELVQFLFEEALRKPTILSQETERKIKQALRKCVARLKIDKNIYNFIRDYASLLLPSASPNDDVAQNNAIKEVLQKKLEIHQLTKLNNLSDLYELVISLWNNQGLLKDKVLASLNYLTITQKGITKRELRELGKFTDSLWTLFLRIFGGVLVFEEGIYSIKSRTLRSVVLTKEQQRQEAPAFKLLTVKHEKIAQIMESTPNCIRKLEEQTFHLFEAKSYFRLKEKISNIENFLLMFNPPNKYELSRYWQKLEQKGFDPVIEYNKAIEGFSMHYHPSDENIFRIIVQISKFLKEFCDFETYQTPTFRHPYIEGNGPELQKIGLLQELKKLQIYIDSSFIDEESQLDPKAFSLEHQIAEVKERMFPVKDGLDTINKMANSALVETVKLKEELTRTGARKSPINRFLSEVEQLNVDVPMNREKFRNHYMQHLQEFIKQQETYSLDDSKEQYMDSDEIDEGTKAPRNISQQIDFNRIRDNYRMRIISPSQYYYKKWIWIQFPWVCISLTNNYSTTPELCKTINDSQIDVVDQEAKFTKQALMVAIEAREKKKKMLSMKDGSFDSPKREKVDYSLNKSKVNVTRNNSLYRFTVKSSQRKTLPESELTLQYLLKELQIRKSRFKDSCDLKNSFFLSEVDSSSRMDSKSQDMKFIALRKQFKSPDANELGENDSLPKLRWAIKEHTNYELDYLKANIEDKKKKLNNLIYSNKKMAAIYTELRMKESLTKKSLNEIESDKKGRKGKALQDLLNKKEEAINEFCKSLVQKERLRIIIRLCAENKTKNEEYLASLNYLLQNLRKMINCEKEAMKAINEKLEGFKAVNERRKQIIGEKEENKQRLKRQLASCLQKKEHFEHRIEEMVRVVDEDVQEEIERMDFSIHGHIKNHEEKDILMLQEKRNRVLEDRSQKIVADYKKLEALFGLAEKQFQTSPRFQQLMAENEKNQKLTITYFQAQNRMAQFQQELRKLKNVSVPAAHFRASKAATISTETARKQLRVDKYLEQLTVRLGIKSKDQVLVTMKSKILQLEQIDPAKWAKVKNAIAIPQLWEEY